jgi:surfactin synthase thioesterase subunit
MSALVPRICDAIEPYLDLPFSFFGHSMGAVISFEVAREFIRRERPLPQWLLVSGSSSPQKKRSESFHLLPMREFIETVARRYNNIPAEVLENPELMNLFGAILQADFELIETYSYVPDARLPINILAFGGLSDESAPPEELERWNEVTMHADQFRLELLAGGHFFINDHRVQITSQILSCLYGRDVLSTARS